MKRSQILRMSEQARKIFRTILTTVFILFSLVVFVGCSYNYLGKKYSRAHYSPHDECQHEIYLIQDPDTDIMCCDEKKNQSNWICAARFDYFNSKFSSKLAFIIPLIPLVCNLIGDHIFSVRSKADNEKAETISVTRNITSHFLRLSLYIVIFAFRTVTLYFIAEEIQKYLQYDLYNKKDCWYRHIVQEQTCKDHFDFSDHVVLHAAHYLVPCAGELAYAFTQYYSRNLDLLNGLIRRYFITILVSLIIMTISFRAVLFTGMFFHTPLETIVGYMIVTLTVVLPMYILAGNSYWTACVFGSKIHR